MSNDNTWVVTGNCQDCRFTDCVTVCPTDAFHIDDRMVYIEPDDCVGCGACEPECPVEAIFHVDDVPADMKHWIAINAQRAPRLPVIDQKQEPLPTAEARKLTLGFA